MALVKEKDMMDERALKTMVERMIAEMLAEGSAPTANKTATIVKNDDDAEKELADITAIDLKKQLLVEDAHNPEALLAMKARTPARLGIGRAGARYKTITALRVRADHAAAQDSVFSDVSEDFIKRNGFVFVQTKCESKDEYLTRPDLGRTFGAEAQEVIRRTYTKGTPVILMVGDGLSSAAIEANVEDCIPAIKQGLKLEGLEIGDILFVKYCRVGAMDAVGDLVDANVICMLVGERPGLVTAESMSAYITYKPKAGIAEAKRTVISNIHSGGTNAVEAGAHIARLIGRMLKEKASGVDLK